MERSEVYKHLSNLSKLAEDFNGIDKQIASNAEANIKYISGRFLDKSKSMKPTTKQKQIEIVEELADSVEDMMDEATMVGEELTEEEMLEKAYDILKSESKPGPTYLSRAMKIEIKDARRLYSKLKREGRFDNPPVKEQEPEQDLMDMINELPEGTNTLVKAPYNLFNVLPEGVRAKYLCGLDIKELISPKELGQAAEDGVDLSLVNQINELARKKKPKVNHIITAIDEKGNQTGETYKRRIKGWMKYIPNADKLFSHMKTGGINKHTLRDLRDIAKACKEGTV